LAKHPTSKEQQLQQALSLNYNIFTMLADRPSFLSVLTSTSIYILFFLSAL
jgi:hypothetical protein